MGDDVVGEKVQRIMELIDNEGSPCFLDKLEWRELLESVQSECESRLEAVNEELDNE